MIVEDLTHRWVKITLSKVKDLTEFSQIAGITKEQADALASGETTLNKLNIPINHVESMVAYLAQHSVVRADDILEILASAMGYDISLSMSAYLAVQ